MSVLAQSEESHRATISHDNKAGEYKAFTWLGRFLFDLVAVWRAAMRPWIVTMLVLFYGAAKYGMILKGVDIDSVWGPKDAALLELGISFYLGKRSFDKKNGKP